MLLIFLQGRSKKKLVGFCEQIFWLDDNLNISLTISISIGFLLLLELLLDVNFSSRKIKEEISEQEFYEQIFWFDNNLNISFTIDISICRLFCRCWNCCLMLLIFLQERLKKKLMNKNFGSMII